MCILKMNGFLIQLFEKGRDRQKKRAKPCHSSPRGTPHGQKPQARALAGPLKGSLLSYVQNEQRAMRALYWKPYDRRIRMSFSVGIATAGVV